MYIWGSLSPTRRGQPAITGHQMSENRGSSVVIDLINHRKLIQSWHSIQSISQQTPHSFTHSSSSLQTHPSNQFIQPLIPHLKRHTGTITISPPALLLSSCLEPPTPIGFFFFSFFFLPSSPKAESGEAFCLSLNSTILSTTPPFDPVLVHVTHRVSSPGRHLEPQSVECLCD